MISDQVIHEAAQFDRPMPHDIDAERCALSAGAIDPAMFTDIRSILKTDDFFSDDHKIVFDAMCALMDRDGAIDYVLIQVEIKRRGLLEDIGGTRFIADTLGAMPGASNGMHFARRVQECSILRKLICQANAILHSAYAPRSQPVAHELAMQHSRELMMLAASGGRSEPVTMEQAAQQFIERLEAPAAQRIPTGLTELDRIIGGMAIGQFLIVGAQPSMGKSALIKQILKNASDGGTACGLISVEEDRFKIAGNAFASATGISNNLIAHGRLNQEEWVKLSAALPKLAAQRIHIVDDAFTLEQIEAEAVKLVAKQKCKIIAIDHIHLIQTSGNDSREREISKISSSLKRLFRRLGVAGIAAAQLNRSHQAGERPTLRSLRDSGTLEQDGDTIILLHRDDYYRYAEQGYEPTRMLECIVAKNKSGAMGIARTHFDGSLQQITDLTSSEMFAAGVEASK